MNETILLSLTAIGLLGAVSQCVAWWVKLPAILFLLLTGLVLGPVMGWLQPDVIFGDLLFPMVSLSVAVILFEGSLTLHFSEIRGLEKVVRNMLSIGLLTTWTSISLATHWIMGFPWALSFLFGALVVVTGPTVIVPMLRTVRPNARISSILRWEGIAIDPLGALLAVLVFDFILSTQSGEARLGHIFLAFGMILATGFVTGALAGYLLGLVLRQHRLPEYLHNFVTLATVFSVFTLANEIHDEAGLLAVTVMGIWMANMKGVPLEGIMHFKESLSLLLISGLFIILAGRLQPEQLLQLGWPALLLFLVIQFVVRPLKVFLSTIGSDLLWQEKVLLSFIAPRGIVAAAVSALFAIKLEQNGVEQAPLMVSLTFMVIIGTVVLQSSTARFLAIWLGVAEPEARGYLIVGANPVARAIAQELEKQGFRCLLTDSHWPHIREARMLGLKTFYGQPTSERADQQLDLVGIGGMLGLSQNDHLNVLAAQRYQAEFGAQSIFTLRARDVGGKGAARHTVATERRGRLLFAETVNYDTLIAKIDQGAELGSTLLSDNYDYQQYLEQSKYLIAPLFAITSGGRLRVLGGEDNVVPKVGWRVVGLFAEGQHRDKASERVAADGLEPPVVRSI